MMAGQAAHEPVTFRGLLSSHFERDCFSWGSNMGVYLIRMGVTHVSENVTQWEVRAAGSGSIAPWRLWAAAR